MSPQRATEARRRYLVDHYRPGLGEEGLRTSALRVRDAATAMERAGKPVSHIRTTLVPADESFFCVFDAASEELVREAYARAGMEFERISMALEEEPASLLESRSAQQV
jgi:Protein of unknown function (DUF4242)